MVAIGAERGLAGRFPEGGVAADRGQGAVPGPDSHGKIEGGDDADHAQRMPLLHHAVLRPLGGDGQPVQLPGKADGEIANINHLLHFAFAFRQDFPGFQRDKSAQIGFGVAQGVAELADDFAAFRRGQALPVLRGPGPARVDRALVIGRGGQCGRCASALPSIGEMLFEQRPAAQPFPAKNAGDFPGCKPSFFKSPARAR